MDTNVPTERGRDGESNHKTFGSNIENTIMNLVYFPLPKHKEKLIGKSIASGRRRRKSRWDERPDDA
ncbi:hypothetical protein TSUD_246420 [Trifolium subterraneum]|uniref:Uncharacterized protein n=1 Tax=Trifolium subterraneum TaxID=3900 RepID=A0A2Z6PGY5_TRISU|nr:hypothetical protein TSUD_246420 [Trifolium subterraneum]